MVVPNNSRLDQILELIREIYGDTVLSRAQVRELLEIIQEEIESHLETLVGDDDEDKPG